MVPLTFRPKVPGRHPPQPVYGTSVHDAAVRLAGRVYDGMRVPKLREAVDPATGETLLVESYPHSIKHDNGVFWSSPVAETEHYAAVPWSPELWDRLYEAHGTDLHLFYYYDYFAPHLGTLRVALEHEAALVGTAPPAEQTTPENDPLDALREAVKSLRLKGNEAAIVQAICDAGGPVPLTRLAAKCKWMEPLETQWNPARYRLNRKLNPRGWNLTTLGRAAVAEQVPAIETERK
jgi:hypothetical protein